jgi:hypothetical protein
LLSTLELLPRMLQALLRHLFAYGELAYAEGVIAARGVRRRMIGGAIACVAGGFAVLMGCVWVIAATWDGPNRQLAVGAMCVGFLLVAASGVLYAFGGGSWVPFEHLRAEWRRDLQEIARLEPTLVGRPDPTGGSLGGHE